jgi:hypothetical protein
MHNAPSVLYPVGRCALPGWLMLALWLLGCVAACATSVAGDFHWGQWRWSVLACALLLAGWTALRTWRALPAQGLLHWDGHDWWWTQSHSRPSDATVPVRLRVHLASQRHLLLHMQPADGAARWLCLCAATAPTHWHALRCAVYSRAVGGVPHRAVSP